MPLLTHCRRINVRQENKCENIELICRAICTETKRFLFVVFGCGLLNSRTCLHKTCVYIIRGCGMIVDNILFTFRIKLKTVILGIGCDDIVCVARSLDRYCVLKNIITLVKLRISETGLPKKYTY